MDICLHSFKYVTHTFLHMHIYYEAHHPELRSGKLAIEVVHMTSLGQVIRSLRHYDCKLSATPSYPPILARSPLEMVKNCCAVGCTNR